MMKFSFKVDVPKYIYPVGRAGKRFGEALKEGKLVVSFCSVCETGFMPPVSYCPHCYVEIKEFIEPESIVLSHYTVVKEDGSEKIYGFIRFIVRGEPAEGGLIHYVEASNGRLEPGMELEPVFKDVGERRGVITDILFFRPRS